MKKKFKKVFKITCPEIHNYDNCDECLFKNNTEFGTICNLDDYVAGKKLKVTIEEIGKHERERCRFTKAWDFFQEIR